MKLNRRQFTLGSTSLLLSGLLPLKVKSSTIDNKKNLVVIMLRGAMDGLTAVPYIHDNTLEKVRPDIFVKKLFKLNSDFSLHPKLSGFHNLWKKDQATIIHATNIPYTGRSHFDGQNLMESGGVIPYKTKTGWLGKGIDVAGLDGLSMSLPMPLLLRGKRNQDNFYPSKFSMPSRNLIDILKNHYADEPLLKKSFDKLTSRPLSMTSAPNSKNIKTLARIAGTELKKEYGPRVAVFEIFGFDTHAAQGGADGEHGQKLKILDETFGVLKKQLGKTFDNTLILTLTEFGRTIVQNSGFGTEHGYGTAVLLGGGLLKKSQVFTDWPGIKKKELFEGRDLNSTLDARSIYCSAMSICFNTDFKLMNKHVFPDKTLINLSNKIFKS